MKTMLMSAAAAMALAIPAYADVIEVQMLNRGDDGGVMVFQPALIEVEVGDTVRFIPTDRGHNAQSVKDALPEGQEAFKGRINQEVEVEITASGLTAVVCQPHVGVGMAALIVAGGDTSNVDAIRDARIRGRSEDRIEELIEEAQANS